MDSLPPFGSLHHPALVSLLHLPAKLRGGDACQKGLSSPPLSKQETHVQERKQLAKLAEKSCLLAPYSTGLSPAPAKRAQEETHTSEQIGCKGGKERRASGQRNGAGDSHNRAC